MWFQSLVLFSGVFVTCRAVCADWDHLVFTRQWAEAVCLKNERSHLIPCCYIPSSVYSWTIHGVWPSKGNEKKPTGCPECAGEFDIKKLAPLKDKLDVFWPTLFPDNGGSMKFWSHEWDKHGRCGVDLAQLKDEYHYFSTGLELHRRYDIDQILRRSAIVPSDTNLYPIPTYLSVLTHALGAEPVIQCFHDTKLDKQYVVQIEVCLSKALRPIKCPHNPAVRNSTEMCILDMPISYPAIQADTQFPPGCVKDDETLYFVPRV